MATGKEIAIKLTNVTKKYLIHHEKPTFIETIINGKSEEFCALNNINLAINSGERVGIIGANGSGKTTLLKLISGISKPTRGIVMTKGKIVSLIDLEAGFHPDLNGIQNIYLNGVILGMNKKEIHRKIDNIIEFADIGKFIDAQIFTYSEGMKLRLGFSIAVHANPDIIILDENLAVGDEDFGKKSFDKLQEIIKQGKTVVVVSHNLDYISRECKRVIWLDHGVIKNDGSATKSIYLYEREVNKDQKLV